MAQRTGEANREGESSMSWTLARAVDWYLNEYLASRPASPRTIETYRSELAHLLRFAALRGCHTPQDVTADVLRQAAVSLMAEGQRAISNEDYATRSKGNEGAARIMVTAARGLARALRETRGLHVPDLASVTAPRVPERLQPRVALDDFARMQHALAARRGYRRFSRFVLARDSARVPSRMETG